MTLQLAKQRCSQDDLYGDATYWKSDSPIDEYLENYKLPILATHSDGILRCYVVLTPDGNHWFNLHIKRKDLSSDIKEKLKSCSVGVLPLTDLCKECVDSVFWLTLSLAELQQRNCSSWLEIPHVRD